MQFLKPVKISITPLSPVHIGCGEDYEPTNYVIKNNVLYGFDPSYVKLFPQEFSKLDSVSRSKRISDWAKFFNENENTFIAYSRSACVCCQKAVTTYKKMISEGSDSNRGLIERTVYIRLPEGDIPYIPGSSIKGAFVTALLNKFKEEGKNLYHEEDKEIFKKIFKIIIPPDLGKDVNVEGVTDSNLTPMRFLKFSDCMPNCNAFGLTEISSANRVSKHKDKTIKIPAMLENTTFSNYRPYIGTITQEDIPYSITKNVGAKFDLKTAIKAVHKFNKDEFEKDKEFWSKWSESDNQKKSKQSGSDDRIKSKRLKTDDWIKSVSKLLEKLDNQIKDGKVCLIRLGKNQGAGGFTLTDNAKILNSKAKKYMDEPTTVLQCDVRGQFLPFGWALLEIAPQEDNIALQEWIKSQENPSVAILNERKLLADMRAKREKRILEEKQRLEEESKHRREEAEKEVARREWLASLPENQRSVEKLIIRMNKVAKINPNDAFYKEVKDFLEKAAQEWSTEDKLMCAEKLQPLVKDKGMYKGKNEKILKNIFKTLRGQ